MANTNIPLSVQGVDVVNPLLYVAQQNRQKQQDEAQAQQMAGQSELRDLQTQEIKKRLEQIPPEQLQAGLQSIAVNALTLEKLWASKDYEAGTMLAQEIKGVSDSLKLPSREIDNFLSLAQQNPERAGSYLSTAMMPVIKQNLPAVFSDIKNPQGQVVAQRNEKTNQLTDAPQSLNPQQADRKTSQDQNGVLRFIDNGSPVFPNVSKEPSQTDRKTAQDVNGQLRYLDTGELAFPEVKKEPSQKEAEEMAAKEIQQKSVITQTADADKYIKDALSLVDEANSGRTGAALAFISPTGKNAELRRKLQTITANIGFDKLMEMKRASPAGGALGSVTETELKFLQSTLGALDPQASDEELKGVLNHVRSVYDRINRGAGGSGLFEQSGSPNPGRFKVEIVE